MIIKHKTRLKAICWTSRNRGFPENLGLGARGVDAIREISLLLVTDGKEGLDSKLKVENSTEVVVSIEVELTGCLTVGALSKPVLCTDGLGVQIDKGVLVGLLSEGSKEAKSISTSYIAHNT
ncbi:transducin/WD40 repeat-like superfamily protein [Actinidia rufa]|uniref:Transducin/WD40 repeat-like superfamily protein n=1 Tax=Actinidia rufa TaxID=165716 RepID=A0A7J0HG65_9ERIC|nr:transducin/WD40 repeat-like superfamily protein [Actinidia rufa]